MAVTEFRRWEAGRAIVAGSGGGGGLPGASWLARVALVGLVLAVLLPPLVAGFLYAKLFHLPMSGPLRRFRPGIDSQITRVFDATGAPIATYRRFDTSVAVEKSDIPRVPDDAVVAAEDQRFYDHEGVDPKGALRALRANTEVGEYAQGASTITQQYVRMAYIGQRSSSYRDKLREAVLARRLDGQLSRDEILFRYLSRVYFGAGAASQTYFRKPVRDLSLSEAALLAGIIPAPTTLEPRTNPAGAELRRQLVLDTMLEQGRISPTQHQQARAERVALVDDGTRLDHDHTVGLPGGAPRGDAAAPIRTRMRRRLVAAALLTTALAACAGATTEPPVAGTASPLPTSPTTLPDEAPPPVRYPRPAPAAPARTSPSVAAAVAARLTDARFGDTTVGLSVWVDGYGEVAAHNADLALTPASTQKLFTAAAALAALGPDATLETAVRAGGGVADGQLQGDLVLVGGGDPSLASAGAHSLDTLAAQVRAGGIRRVTGDLVGDESRFDAARTAPGWLDWHVPGVVGPLSALAVDANSHRRDADYVAEPVKGNLRLFRAALARHGVAVDGGDVGGRGAPDAAVVASRRSAPMVSLVADMLTRSDNLAAELLLKEIGVRRRGVGSTAAGLDAAAEALGKIGLPVRGTAADGSGLSRHNRRSPREWRELLQAAVAQPWGPAFVAGLPLAGRTGTLRGRFQGTPLEGTLRAKTGWILEGRALSGYLTTAGGRGVVFSVVVNRATPSSPAVAAIDELVQAIAADTS